MPNLRYLAQAKDDLISIQRYIAQQSGSKETARQYSEQLRAQCRTIAAFPGLMGRERSELRERLRSVAHGNYVIFFLYKGDSLDIVSIIEGHRDIEGLFINRNPNNKEG